MTRKSLIPVILFLLLSTTVFAGEEKYEPNWRSLDQRENPEWFRDAKLGIFIHWGIYAVPAWGPKGSYSEWYWNGLRDPESERAKRLKRIYGANFKYQDFAPMWKAEDYDPDKWADLFHRAGAKYVVLTSKHHEGFCLWPSQESWNWNSIDIGPHRDLLGDLTNAVRKTDMRMGFYYSLYEWFNPLYRSDLPRYVKEYMLPQFKDVVTRYKPDIIFADGEWDHPSAAWKSEEFLAWLFNESPAPKDIVINDRWGNDTRQKHGGYYSTEYKNVNSGIDENLVKRGWEECRGLGRSFGYNANEDIEDYISPEKLIHMFIEIISKGGNLLLNVGPTASGRIPVIMQERLLQLGEWIARNEEAVYGTRIHRTHKDGDSVRYTRSKDGRYVYAILLKKPGANVILNNTIAKPGSEIAFLGYEQKLNWERKGEQLVVNIPNELRFNLPGDFAWIMRIEPLPYVSKPVIKTNAKIAIDKPMRVELKCATPDAALHYTIDGTIPNEQSPLYTGPFELKKSAALKVKALKTGMAQSLLTEGFFDVVDSKKNGVEYSYFEGKFEKCADLEKLKPATMGKTYQLNFDDVPINSHDFGLILRSKIAIASEGKYTFSLVSDDGSQLYINDELLIDNDGRHRRMEKSASVKLKEGMQAIRVHFFQNRGDKILEVFFDGPDITKRPIPASILMEK